MSHRYLLFYKPFDVLCQFTNPDGLACKTLKDFIDVPDVYSVGRLDRDSEGLLLLTDHGAMKHRLTHPQFQHPRTYWVQVERCPDDASLQQLRDGVVIKGGYQTRPAEVKLLSPEPGLPARVPPIRFRKTVPTAWLSLTITEGRNRQVRRMTAAVGYPTLRLVRVGMGEIGDEQRLSEQAIALEPAHTGIFLTGLLTLGDLQPGDWRELRPAEVAQLPRIWAASQGATREARTGREIAVPVVKRVSTGRTDDKATKLGQRDRSKRRRRGGGKRSRS